MKLDLKNAFIYKKFKMIVLGSGGVLLLILCIAAYLGTKAALSSDIKHNAISSFNEANSSLYQIINAAAVKTTAGTGAEATTKPETAAAMAVEPATKGILYAGEGAVILKKGKILYEAGYLGRSSGLVAVVARKASKKSPIDAVLYLNMDKRAKQFFDVYYKLVIPVILLTIGSLLLLSILLVKRITQNLNRLVQEVSENEVIGEDYNYFSTFENESEAGILSKEFVRLNTEIGRLRDKERQFVRDAYYEMKNPLAMMEANLGIMEKRNISDEGRNVAREAMKTVLFDAKEKLDTLLDLSHEEIIVREKVENLNLADLILEMLEEYKKLYPSFSFKTDLDSLTTNIRKADLTKLVTILLENAVRYSTEELKEVIIKVKSKGKKNYLIVEDFGVGMTAENVEKVFDLFWKYDNKRAISNGGAGMGLATAKKLCDRYRFHIKVSSHLNIGTSVIVELN